MKISDIEWQLGCMRSARNVFDAEVRAALTSAEYIVGTARQVTDSANVDTDTLVKRLHMMQGAQADLAVVQRAVLSLGAIENLTNDEAHDALVMLVDMLKVKL